MRPVGYVYCTRLTAVILSHGSRQFENKHQQDLSQRCMHQSAEEHQMRLQAKPKLKQNPDWSHELATWQAELVYTLCVLT